MQRKHTRVTIKQVAQEVGVSTQTVSRVLNNRPDVSPETRQTILDAIERLGYRPSALARSLIQQRSYTLGVAIAGLRHRGPSRTLSGITEQAEAMGYSLLLKHLVDYGMDEGEPVLYEFLDRQVDGIIWAVSEVGDNRQWICERLPSLETPVVFTTMHQRAGISTVAYDNRLGGRLAAQHLLNQGYQHIGHITGPMEWWEVRERLAGWQDCLRDAGIQTEKNHWAVGDWSSGSGEGAFHQLAEQYPEMDALSVANDQMALGAINAAYQHGMRIPQDLGIVGFDGIPEAAYFWPPLTTVQQDQEKLGELAVQQLLAHIESLHDSDSDYEAQSVWLQPELVVRQSSCR